MTDSFVAAVVQMTTTADRAANRASAEALTRRARKLGAHVVALPEMWPFIGNNVQRLAEAEDLDGPTVGFLSGLAKELGIWLFGGSFAEISEDPARVYNTAVAFAPDGDLVGVYRKIHLFDIDVPGAQFVESDDVSAGDRAVLVPTPLGVFGMTTCYDLRFPALYQQLREAGADFVMVPSAFTSKTGKAHWEVLLRARAIEQQVYVLAPDQCGRHSRTRESHGHSMIVDPWGLVVARCSDGPGVALAQVEPDRTARIRRELPCGEHRRDFDPPQRS